MCKSGENDEPKNIESHADTFPCHYIVFDLLKLKGEDKGNSRLTTRKQLLSDFLNVTIYLYRFNIPIQGDCK